jgi:hypothetical protein
MMNADQRSTELRSVITNPVFTETMDELERDAFDKFMALPMTARMGDEGRNLIAHIDALRNVRDTLHWLASTQPRAPLSVV